MSELPPTALLDAVKSEEPDARSLRGWMSAAARGIAVAFALFHLVTAAPFVGALPDLIQRSVHLALALVLCFLLYPARRSRAPASRFSPAEVALACGAAVALGYVIYYYDWIMENPEDATRTGVVLGSILTLIVLEAARRTIGLAFASLAAAAVAYAYFGAYVPGTLGHRGIGWTTIQQTLYLSTQGILGAVTGVSATVVAVFLVFGAVLARTGGGETFVDLAKLLAGRSVGGPAKVSVFSSAFFGTISGSAVANVVVDGVFNIPLMKRLKYRPEFAAAVEATASTGGQIMPPVMGAGAFVMAELLQLPYAEIAIAAALPAILYYLGCGSAIHFEARRLGLATIPREQIPRAREVLAWRRSAALFVPVILLSYFLLAGYTVGAAVFWSVLVALAIYLGAAASWTDLKARCTEVMLAFEEGGRAIVLVATLIGAAGIVIGVINVTGVGVKMSELVMGAAGGSLLAALFFAMLVCLVLGMGLPTTAAYMLAASVVAPAIVRLGAPPLAAHLFVFYFAIISAITPPVCAAVYVAAAIANANWAKTGWVATRLGLAGFITPYMFVYSPALLWQGGLIEIAWATLSACVGVIALAGAAMGFFHRAASPVERLMLFGAALLLIEPGLYTDLAGGVALAAVAVLQHARSGPAAAWLRVRTWVVLRVSSKWGGGH